MGATCSNSPAMNAEGATANVQIYGMAISGNVIPLVLFVRDKACGEFVQKDILRGEHTTPEMLAINPWGQVPSMTDGDFKLAESNAILRYLADSYALSTYGNLDAKQRAHIDWALDWCSTNFMNNYKEIWYPVAGFGNSPADQKASNQKATDNLLTFENFFLKGKKFIGGDALNIADYKVGALLWYLDHPAIKAKTGFQLSARCKTYVQDWHAALGDTSKQFLENGKGFMDSFMDKR